MLSYILLVLPQHLRYSLVEHEGLQRIALLLLQFLLGVSDEDLVEAVGGTFVEAEVVVDGGATLSGEHPSAFSRLGGEGRVHDHFIFDLLLFRHLHYYF